MKLITPNERVELLKNLLADPDDWISYEILRLSEEEEESDAVMGIRNSDPATCIRQSRSNNKIR